jgi:orotidine-5'-phosphate decarboxylase
MKTSPVIVALDLESGAEARTLIAALGDSASF